MRSPPGPRLLLIAPVTPAEGGNGLAMRAGLFLDALAADHRVTLVVIPVAEPRRPRALPAFVTRRAARAHVVPLEGRSDPAYQRIGRLADPARRLASLRAHPRPSACRFATDDAVRAVARAAGTAFDVVHVMRLYLAPFAAPYLAARSGAARLRVVIDLDDDEPTTHRRLAALHALRGHGAAAALEAAEAGKYEVLERAWLARADRVLVCSRADAESVTRRLGLGTVAVVPNAVRVPRPGPRPRPGADFCLLLVGSLGYFPNTDAALQLCHEILPRLRARADRPVRVQIAGGHPPPAVRALADLPGVTVTASPADVAPLYAGAHVAIVPVRAGGGTRIKVLEAFAHRVPVVASPIGAEGLDVEAGRHLLVAADPDGAVVACLRLMRDPALGVRLADEAARLVRARYRLARVAATIRTLYADLRSPPDGRRS